MVALRDKNEDLNCSRLGAEESDEPNDLVPLTQNLSGVIDAAVAGGIANYIAAFFDGSYLRAMPHEAPRIREFKHTLETQLERLNAGLGVFGRKLKDNPKLAPLFKHLQTSYQKMVVQLAKGILKRKVHAKKRSEFSLF